MMRLLGGLLWPQSKVSILLALSWRNLFVLELADNLCLPSQGIQIDRAGAMLHCILGFVKRSWCLIEVLRHSRRVGVYR